MWNRMKHFQRNIEREIYEEFFFESGTIRSNAAKYFRKIPNILLITCRWSLLKQVQLKVDRPNTDYMFNLF